MSAQTEKSDYMLLFRGTNWDKGMSPEQAQKIVTDWYAWFNGLLQDGRAVSGHPLLNEGKIITGKNRAVADGPFAESKEAIGGYFYLRVADLDEAIEIARQCPALGYGSFAIEVRPVADVCPIKERATRELAEAVA